MADKCMCETDNAQYAWPPFSELGDIWHCPDCGTAWCYCRDKHGLYWLKGKVNAQVSRSEAKKRVPK